MKSFTPLALTAALAAAALLPALVPADCPAQEKPAADAPAARRVERIYDIGGIRTPVCVTLEDKKRFGRIRPFGLSPGLFDQGDEEDPTIPDARPTAEHIGEMLRACLPPAIAEDLTRIRAVWEGEAVSVDTTEEGHRIVAAALEAMRRGAVPFQFDVRAVALRDDADAPAILAELDRLGAAPVPPTLVERVLSADARGGLRGGTVNVFSGTPAQIERIETRSVVSEWQVEIAQAASIADPVPVMVEDGLRAFLAASQTSDGGRTIVRFAAASGDLQRPIRRVEMRTKDLGTAEMPEVRGGFVATEWSAKPGETTAIVMSSPVTGTLGGGGAVVREVLLVKLVSAPPAPVPGALDVVPVGSIASEVLEAVLLAPAMESTHENLGGCLATWWRTAPARCTGSMIEERVRAADPGAAEVNWNIAVSDGDAPCGAALAVTGTDAFRASARATVAAMEKDLLHGAHVSVRLAARDAAGTSERTLGLVSGPAMNGRNLALAAYASVPYVGDYDVEVAQEARIADPRVNVALGGLVVNVRVSQGPADGWRADVDLTAASIGAIESAPVASAEVGTIERCTIRRVKAKEPVVLENGKTKEMDLGANPWGPGRLVAIIRVDR